MTGPRIGLFGRGRLGSAIAAEAGRPWPGRWTRVRRPGPADVAIDASIAVAVESHLAWALETGTDLVIGVTGWSLPDLEARVGDRIGVLTSSNFSLTVALMARLATVLGRFAALDPARIPSCWSTTTGSRPTRPRALPRPWPPPSWRGCRGRPSGP